MVETNTNNNISDNANITPQREEFSTSFGPFNSSDFTKSVTHTRPKNPHPHTKRNYSLNMDLQYATERVAHVKNELATMKTNPTPSDLNDMATWILYGKDETFRSPIERKICYDESPKHSTFRKKGDKNLSLDAILESPLSTETVFKPLEERNIYRKIRPSIARPTLCEASLLTAVELAQGQSTQSKPTSKIICPFPYPNPPSACANCPYANTHDCDGWIPGMRQLWDSIDYLQFTYDCNTGKKQHQPLIDPPISNLTKNQASQLRHWIIEHRTDQYLLKDMFAPTLHFFSVAISEPQFIDWTCDSGYWCGPKKPYTLQSIKEDKLYIDSLTPTQIRLDPNYNTILLNGKNIIELLALINIQLYNEDGQLRFKQELFTDIYEVSTKISKSLLNDILELLNKTIQEFHIVREHTIDYENPQHIKYIIDYYGDIMKQVWDIPDTYARAIIFDIDRYIDMTELTPVRFSILQHRIDKWSYDRIRRSILDEFGVDYDAQHIAEICNKEIPTRISRAVAAHRVWSEARATHNLKKCYECGRELPRDTLFYERNSAKRDGLAPVCKRCKKNRRLKSGQQTPQDKRYKDPYAIIGEP